MGSHQKKVADYEKLFDRTVKQKKESSFIDQNHAVQLCYEARLSALEKEKNQDKAGEKKAALNEAYNKFWIKRYLVFFGADAGSIIEINSIRKKLNDPSPLDQLNPDRFIFKWEKIYTDDEIKRAKRVAFAEIHPDKNRERNADGLSRRRAALARAFEECMKKRDLHKGDPKDRYEEGLKQDAITRRQQGLKQWFWDKAHDPQHRNNESIQIGAYYLWGEEYAQSIETPRVDTIQADSSFLSSREYTPAELNALAIVRVFIKLCQHNYRSAKFKRPSK